MCSILEDYNADLQNMDACSVIMDPLQSYIYEANVELTEINVEPISLQRSSSQFFMPMISDISVPTILYAPSSDRIFSLQVDLRLFKNLFWYKNYDEFVRYAKINTISKSLLKSINLLNARYYNSSTQVYTTLVDAYIAYITSSNISALHPYIRQKINISLYNKLYFIIDSMTSDILYSLVSTILYNIKVANPSVYQSSALYYPAPFVEVDNLMFAGTIETDSSISPFLYGIDLILTTTISPSIPDYSSVTSQYESTDTFILLPMTSGVVSNTLPITNIVKAYIPVNLGYTRYKYELLSLYAVNDIETTFAMSLTQADSYFTLSTSNYLYEMYAIGILTQIALYYRTSFC